MWGLGGRGEPVDRRTRRASSRSAAPAGQPSLKATDGEHAPATSAPVTVRDAPITGIEIVMKGGARDRRPRRRQGRQAASPYATVRVPVARERRRMGRWRRLAQRDDRQGRPFEVHGLPRSKHQARARVRRLGEQDRRRRSHDRGHEARCRARARRERHDHRRRRRRDRPAGTRGPGQRVPGHPRRRRRPKGSRSPACRRRPPMATARSRSTACPTARIELWASRSTGGFRGFDDKRHARRTPATRA